MTIAAMKQALEALTEHGAPYLRHGVDWDNAITVLRAAIAEQEKAEPVAVLQTDNSGRFLDCIYRGAATPADQFLWQEDKRIPRSTSIRLFTHPAPVPAGWQLVPVEPTDEMIRASHDLASIATYSNGQHTHIPIAYKAMLAAAPKPGEMK
jgi:hypothetical protein